MKNDIKSWLGISFVAFTLILWFVRTYVGAEIFFIEYLQFFSLLFFIAISMLTIARSRRIWVLGIAIVFAVILDPYFLSEIFTVDAVKSKYRYLSLALSMLGVYIVSVLAVIFAEVQKFKLTSRGLAIFFALTACVMAYWPYFRWA
jgi:hypothetical protein